MKVPDIRKKNEYVKGYHKSIKKFGNSPFEVFFW